MEWQISLARERAALRDAHIDAEDRGILLGYVLPTMAHTFKQSQLGSAMVTFYNRQPVVCCTTHDGVSQNTHPNGFLVLFGEGEMY